MVAAAQWEGPFKSQRAVGRFTLMHGKELFPAAMAILEQAAKMLHSVPMCERKEAEEQLLILTQSSVHLLFPEIHPPCFHPIFQGNPPSFLWGPYWTLDLKPGENSSPK